MKPLQLIGPACLSDLRIDISAHAEDPAADDDQIRLMLRRLLADRFGMQIHREQKEPQVYVLTVAKNGPKFHATGTKDASRFVESTDRPSGFSEDKTGAVANKVSQLLDAS